MNELDDRLRGLGDALDDTHGMDAGNAADQARRVLLGAIRSESPGVVGHRRWRARRWSSDLVAISASIAVAVAVLWVAASVGGHRASSGARVPTRLPLGTTLNPSGPTGVIAGTVRLQTVVDDPEHSGPAWGLKTYRVKGDTTCMQAGREQAGQIGAVGAYGSFGNDGRFHPFTFSDVGFGTCVPNDAHQHAFANIAYDNAPASASGEPCQTFPHGLPSHLPAQVKTRLLAQSHAAACRPRNQRLIAFGLLGPDAMSVTHRTAHGTATTPTHGPDGAYLIVQSVNSAICGATQCGYSGGGSSTAMSLPTGLITTITYRHAPTCHVAPPDGNLRTSQRLAPCHYIGYVAPRRPKLTAADVSSPVTAQLKPARFYCIPQGSYRPSVLRIPCDHHVPAGYLRLTHDPRQLLAYISWTAKQPVTNINSSAYAIQVTSPRGCGGGQTGRSTQSLISRGERITRDIEVPSRCPGTYHGSVTYQPSLGPAGQTGIGLPGLRATGTYLVGHFAITVP